MFGYVLGMLCFDYKVCWCAYEVVVVSQRFVADRYLDFGNNKLQKHRALPFQILKQFNRIKKDIHV